MKLTFHNTVLGPAAIGFFALCWMLSNDYWLAVLVLWSLISGLGVAVGFHRVYSHKTHNPRKWLDILLLLFGSLAGQGSSITWVAVHRGYHHRFTDQEKDLHSPIHGLWRSFLGWYSQIDEHTINHKYAVDLLRNPLHVWVHKHYLELQFRIYFLLFGLSLLVQLPILQLYLACLFISVCQDNVVNTLCHVRKLGYKNFESADNSVNVPLLGYLTWGQAHHANHHFDPGSFSFKKRWWEFDPAVLWLPLIKWGSK